MPYKDSYVAKIREKIGHDFKLIMPTSDVVIENDAGQLMMIYNRDFDGWAFPGGYVEPELSWPENAAREVLEESGINAAADDLIAIGMVSGPDYQGHYPNGDVTQLFSNIFLLQNWSFESDMIDESEIDGKKWVSPQEIEAMHLTFSGRAVYQIYRYYKITQQAQILTTSSQLQRFVDAQDGKVTAVSDYVSAVAELSAGQKQTHWMWFVLPQLRGLGSSERARYYGIADVTEAKFYLGDDLLRQRLEKVLNVLLSLETTDPVAVFGQVDAKKLQASLTLFAYVAHDKSLYQRALEQYFDGKQHQETLDLLAQSVS